MSENLPAEVGAGLPSIQNAFHDPKFRELIAEKYAKNCSKEEWLLYEYIAVKLQLNPFLNEIYCIKVSERSPAAVVIGINGYRLAAAKTGQLDGVEAWCDGKVPDLTGHCKVYRKDMSHPFVVSAKYSEFVKTKSDGTVTKFWAVMPEHMIKKVAESLAYRQAFPELFNGTYTDEELLDGPAAQTVVVPDTSRPSAAAKETAPAEDKCPDCGADLSTVLHLDKIERECGRRICRDCFDKWWDAQHPEPEPKPTPAPEPAAPAKRVCVECGAELSDIHASDKILRACGRRLCQECFNNLSAKAPEQKPEPKAPAKKPQKSTPPPKTENRCADCGKVIDEGLDVCPDCQQRREEGEPKVSEPEDKPAGSVCHGCGGRVTPSEERISMMMMNKPLCKKCLDTAKEENDGA